MTKIFIDTNIFLGLYESHNDPITIFEDISKLKPHLIFTDQVYDEFLRNRDILLQNLIKDCQANKCTIKSSSIIKSLNEFSELKKIESQFDEAKQLLINALNEIQDKKEKDFVLKSFLDLYRHSQVYKRNDVIIKKAHERKLLGNPPISKEKNTIGDEVTWETILAYIKDDLVIITRDGTYKQRITFLKEEFNLKTKKQLSVYENISEALKIIGAKPSVELNKFEEEQSKISEEQPKGRLIFRQDASGNYMAYLVDKSGNISDSSGN